MCRGPAASAASSSSSMSSDDNSTSGSSSSMSNNNNRNSNTRLWRWLVHWFRLPMCTMGICVAYLYYGIFQERLFTNPNERLGASFVLVTSCITNVAVAILWNAIQTTQWFATEKETTTKTLITTKDRALNHNLLLLTSTCYIGAMVGSNEAVPYVSYPVAVLAKSCKLIPIMLVGQFVEKKMYTILEWTAALFISLGIVIFQFSRMTSSTTSSSSGGSDAHQAFGMGLLFVSLVLDGLLASCQNVLKKQFEYRVPTATETMLYVNLYALWFIVPWTWYTGQWDKALVMFHEHPELIQKLTIINAVVACGQVFIFLTITWYSSVVTTTITTTRKFFTILLSVHTFGHVFSTLQWASIAMVFCGLYLAIVAQQKQQKQTKVPTSDQREQIKQD